MKSAVLAVILALALSVAGTAAPITVIDDAGRHITLTRAPQRIVSLTPGTTEMLFAVGAGARVVGDTTACDYPPAAAKIAKIGGWMPDYERILALRPDLVVVDDVAEHAAANRLQALGRIVLIIEPTSIATVERDLTLIGKATGNDAAAAAAVMSMKGKVDQAGRIAKADPARPKVLAVIGYNPLWVAGGGTFIDDVLSRAGAVNVAASVHGYAQYSNEEVIARAPDVLIGDPVDINSLVKAPAFRIVPAVRRHRIVIVDGNLLMRPGPRLADGLLAVARALHRSS